MANPDQPTTPLAEARVIAEGLLSHWRGVRDGHGNGMRAPDQDARTMGEIADALIKIIAHIELLQIYIAMK